MNEKVKAWLLAAGVRALKTMAQTGAALLAQGTICQDIDWAMVGSAALLSGVLSILTSIAGIPEVAGGLPLGDIVKIDEDEDE